MNWLEQVSLVTLADIFSHFPNVVFRKNLQILFKDLFINNYNTHAQIGKSSTQSNVLASSLHHYHCSLCNHWQLFPILLVYVFIFLCNISSLSLICVRFLYTVGLLL